MTRTAHVHKRVRNAAPTRRRRALQVLGAFTLLEVMVAVAILGVSLTAIFASEGGAIRVAGRARRTTTATLLARCKMAEMEEEVMRTGLPAVSATGVDGCCEDGEVEGFECTWESSRIVLPDQIGEGGDEEGGGLAGAFASGGSSGPAASSLTEAPPIDQIMSGAMTSGVQDPIGSLALSLAFPVLKPQIEEQVRRASVRVSWHEGDEETSFEVVQFLIAEQPPAAVTEAAAEAAIGAMSGALGGSTPPVTPTPAPGQSP